MHLMYCDFEVFDVSGTYFDDNNNNNYNNYNSNNSNNNENFIDDDFLVLH